MAIIVGSVEVDVVPTTSNFARTIRRELIPDAEKLGREIGSAIGRPISERIGDAVGDGLKGAGDPARAGAKVGEQFGGAFSTAVQTRIRAALKALPTTQIGVATSEADQKLRDLREELATLADKRVGIDIDSTEALAEVERIQGELARLATESPDVQVRVDTGKALAELALLQVEIARLDGSDIDIDVNVDKGLSSINQLTGRIQALALAGVAIGPAFVPAAALAVGAVGAIGPAAIAATAGVGVIALGFTGITDAVTATAEAQKTAGKSAATIAADQKKAADALAGLSPAGRVFVGFINDKLRPAFDSIHKAAQQGLIPGVQKGLEALLPILPGLTTFVGKLASTMGQLFAKAGQALTSPFWQQFGTSIAGSATLALRTLTEIAGDLVHGFAGIIKAFIPFSTNFTSGLADMTGKFAAWGEGLSNNAGFQKFIDYVTANGPRVLDALGQIGSLIGHIVEAAAPLGIVVVAAIDTLARAFNAIPTPVLTALLALLAAYAVNVGVIKAWAFATNVGAFATKAWAFAQGAATIALNLTNSAVVKQTAFMVANKVGFVVGRAVAIAYAIGQGIATAATQLWTIAQIELNIAMLANPIGLVILAIVAIIAIIVLVVTHFDFFKKAAIAVWNWFKDHWKQILVFISGPIGLAVDLVVKYWDNIKAGAKAVWDFITGGFGTLLTFFKTTLPNQINDAAAGLWHGLVDGFKAAINALIGLWNQFDLVIGGGSFAGVDIPRIDLMPNIPLLASGGIITRPTLAMIGEAGPEAVVPLRNSAQLASALGRGDSSSTGVSGQPITINQVINNPVPERATTSAPVALRRAAYALGAL